MLTGGIESLMSGRERVAFERTVVPPFLTSRRWFGAKGSRIRAVKVIDCAALKDVDGSARFLLPRLQVQLANGESHEYFMPVGVEEGREDETLLPFAVARVRRGPRTGLLYGAAGSNDFAACLIDDMRQGREIPTESGSLVFAVTSAFDPAVTVDVADIRRLSAEQSNTSIAIGSKMMLKLLRRLQPGMHPEIEVGRFLTEEAGFSNTPALLGTLEHVAEDGTRTALAVLQKFVMNQGDAWTLMLEGLRRDFETVVLTPESEAATPAEAFQAHGPWAALLGRRTAELHAALAIETDDPAFAAEPFTEDDLGVLARDARHQAERAFRALKGLADRGLDAGKPACAELGQRRQRGRGADRRPHRRAAAGRPQDPHPRRLPSGTGPGRRERPDHRRLRGRALAARRRAPGEVDAAARRGRADALLRVRGRDRDPRDRRPVRRYRGAGPGRRHRVARHDRGGLPGRIRSRPWTGPGLR